MDENLVRSPDGGFLHRYLPRLGLGQWLGLAYAFLALVFALAVVNEFAHIQSNANAMARERGNVLFRLIELTRDWNARHGGVYVKVTERTQPNQYLDHPRRDLQTIDGEQLTMVNPAFMTRQIAEIAEQIDGVRFHITSLKPIRPANQPDPWEVMALKAFEETGLKERLELVRTNPEHPVHRYMAPLYVKEPCLKCHAKQGYELGQIRGGISVTMPAENILSVVERQQQRTLFAYGLVTLLIAALVRFIALRTYRHVQDLRQLAATQEALVAERTQALRDSNERLQDEVHERQAKEAQIAESESRYRSVIQTSQDAILIVTGPEFRIVFANPGAQALFGVTGDGLLGALLSSLVLPSVQEEFDGWLDRTTRFQQVGQFPGLLLRRVSTGELRIGELYMAAIERGDNQQWVVTIRDMTDQLAAERRLKIAAAVMENAAEGIMVTNADNQIIEVNPAFTAITGFRPAEVLGKNPRVLSSGRHGREFFNALWQSLAVNGRWEGEIWNRRHDGTVYPEWLAITTIQGNNASLGGRYVATFTDISQRKEAEDLLRHKAHTDPLTGLPNRLLFYDRLSMIFNQSRRYEEQFVLMYIDLDRFKEVNDSLGHAAGDELLIEAGRRMTLAVRESDTVARLGGDEFAIILPKLEHPSEAEEVAARIVRLMAEPVALKEGVAQVSASIGLALYPDHAVDLEQLKRCADSALYQVKKRGRNGFSLFMPDFPEN